MNTLKDRLISARTEKKLSQAGLAKLAKCGQTTIASIENGRNQSSKLLPRLAEILNVHVKWLSEGKGDRYPTPIDPVTAEILRLYDVLPSDKQELLLEHARLLHKLSK